MADEQEPDFPARTTTRLLGVAVALLLVMGAIASGVVDGRDGAPTTTSADASGVDEPSATTTTAIAPPTEAVPSTSVADASTTAPPASRPPTASRGTPSPTAGTAPPTTAATAAVEFRDLGPASDPGPVRVPKPGRYRYRATIDGEQTDASTSVAHRGSEAGGTALTLTMTGQGLDAEHDVLWRDDRVLVRRTAFTFGTSRGDCDWDPDHIELQLPLAQGASWQSQSSCAVSGFGPAPVTVTRTTTASVGEARRVAVAGREVTVWVITGTERLDVAGRVMESRATTWFAPAYGLIVRSTSDGSNGHMESQLLNLEPE